MDVLKSVMVLHVLLYGVFGSNRLNSQRLTPVNIICRDTSEDIITVDWEMSPHMAQWPIVYSVFARNVDVQYSQTVICSMAKTRTSATCSGLLPGYLYQVTVTAQSTGEKRSASITHSTKPAIPGALSLASDVSSTNITLTWQKSSGKVGYYWIMVRKGDDEKYSGQVILPRAEIPGLKAGEDYSVVIVAISHKTFSSPRFESFKVDSSEVLKPVKTDTSHIVYMAVGIGTVVIVIVVAIVLKRKTSYTTFKVAVSGATCIICCKRGRTMDRSMEMTLVNDTYQPPRDLPVTNHLYDTIDPNRDHSSIGDSANCAQSAIPNNELNKSDKPMVLQVINLVDNTDETDSYISPYACVKGPSDITEYEKYNTTPTHAEQSKDDIECIDGQRSGAHMIERERVLDNVTDTGSLSYESVTGYNKNANRHGQTTVGRQGEQSTLAFVVGTTDVDYPGYVSVKGHKDDEMNA